MEVAELELLHYLGPRPGLAGAALLHHADEQHVVLHGPHLALLQPLPARRAPGRQEATGAPAAEGVTARHGHRLAHQEEAQRTLEQLHGGRLVAPEPAARWGWG